MSDTPLPALVIDDFATMTRIMKAILQQLGFDEIDASHDGPSALAMLRRKQYGLVLCDLEMEPMNGAEFARQARLEPNGANCLILITTASRESAAKAVQSGVHRMVDGFVLKPFRADDLRAKIADITERRLRPREDTDPDLSLD